MRKDTKTAQALASSLYFLFDFNNEAHNKDVIRTLKPTTVFLYLFFFFFSLLHAWAGPLQGLVLRLDKQPTS